MRYVNMIQMSRQLKNPAGFYTGEPAYDRRTVVDGLVNLDLCACALQHGGKCERSGALMACGAGDIDQLP
jgi:hypothetical protein